MSIYSYFGYPTSKNKKYRSRISNSPYCYYNYGLNSEEILKCGYDPVRHIVVNYDFKKTIDILGNPKSFPDPHGISGGGIWKIMCKEEIFSNCPKPIFVGITIEHSLDSQYWVGIKAGFILECIKLIAETTPD